MSTFRMLLAILLASLCLATARADIILEPENDHQPDKEKIFPKGDQMASFLHEFTKTAEVEVPSDPELDLGLSRRMGQPQIVMVAGEDSSNVAAILSPRGGAIDAATTRLLFAIGLLGMATSLSRSFGR